MKSPKAKNGGTDGGSEADNDNKGGVARTSRRHVKLRFLPKSRTRLEQGGNLRNPPAALSELVPLPPPPLPPPPRHGTPGAFSATAGGSNAQPHYPGRISLTDNQELDTDNDEHDEPYMAVANLVVDDPELPRAEVVDPKRPYLWYGLSAVFLLFLATGIVLVLVILWPTSVSSGEAPKPTEEVALPVDATTPAVADTENASIAPSIDTTGPSSYYESSQPSTSSPTIQGVETGIVTPSQTPTVGTLGGLQESYEAYITSLLPNYALAAIEDDPWSPQSVCQTRSLSVFSSLAYTTTICPGNFLLCYRW